LPQASPSLKPSSNLKSSFQSTSHFQTQVKMLFTQQILALALAGLAFSAPLPDAGAGETNPVRDFVGQYKSISAITKSKEQTLFLY
jgi:hypothetical protein